MWILSDQSLRKACRVLVVFNMLLTQLSPQPTIFMEIQEFRRICPLLIHTVIYRWNIIKICWSHSINNSIRQLVILWLWWISHSQHICLHCYMREVHTSKLLIYITFRKCYSYVSMYVICNWETWEYKWIFWNLLTWDIQEIYWIWNHKFGLKIKPN